MLRDKVLFLLERYKYNYNIIFLLRDLFLLKISTSKIISLKTLKRLLIFTLEDNSNINESNANIFSYLIPFSIKRITLTPRVIKKNRALYLDIAKIVEVNAILYY